VSVTAPPGPIPADGLRIGHVDRERVVHRLCAAAGEGRLTVAEAVDRQAVAYAARFPWELAALLVDLPAELPDVTSADVGRPDGDRLRDALRTIVVINGVGLSVGLSRVPGAAALAALLCGITIMLVVVAAEGLAGLHITARHRRRGR
jgi:hypothetical protein